MMDSNTVVPYDTLDPYNRYRDTTDPCSNNHRQNTESVAAWEQTLHGLARMQKLVFAEVEKAHPMPITPKEIAANLGRPLHAISGRVTGGKQAGILRATDIIRDGSRAVALTEEWVQILGL